jgi:hypothetical protein
VIAIASLAVDVNGQLCSARPANTTIACNPTRQPGKKTLSIDEKKNLKAIYVTSAQALRYDRCDGGAQTPTGVRYVCPPRTVCVDTADVVGTVGTVISSPTGTPEVGSTDLFTTGPCIAAACLDVGLFSFGPRGMKLLILIY